MMDEGDGSSLARREARCRLPRHEPLCVSRWSNRQLGNQRLDPFDFNDFRVDNSTLKGFPLFFLKRIASKKRTLWPWTVPWVERGGRYKSIGRVWIRRRRFPGKTPPEGVGASSWGKPIFRIFSKQDWRIKERWSPGSGSEWTYR